MHRRSVILLQLVRRILQIAAILLAFVAVGLSFVGDSADSFFGSLLVGVIFVGISGGAAAGLMFLSRKLGQRIYDMEAATLFKEIVEGQRKIFSVFLRPFYVTNKLFESRFVTGGPDTMLPTTYLKNPNSWLEVELVKAMRGTSPVIGLGRPGEALGVGRILTNEQDWRVAVTGLIDCATYIFCIPSGHPGTLWEIDHIVEHSLLAKTIFIMPPLPQTRRKKEKFGLEEDWANLIVEMKKRGLTFPKYEKEGMLFSIKSANSVDTQTFELNSPRSIRMGVEALVTAPAKLAANTKPAANTWKNLITFLRWFFLEPYRPDWPGPRYLLAKIRQYLLH
jgi:hypothetical protein